MSDASISNRRALVLGAVVFLIALALRLALLHTARFGGDEALFFGIGLDIVDGKHLPLLGTQITDGQGRLPGPAFLYLMALPLLIARAPEAQYAFTEVLGAVTVGVFWHAMRRPFGEVGAAFAALLLALSPWSALYADRTWNPNVLPLFVALGLLAALRVREDPRSRWLCALVPLCAVMPQLHMSAPVAWAGLVVVAWPALARRRDIPRRHIALALALAAALYVPLAIHEIATGFGNTRAILNETVGNGDRHPLSFLWVPVYALRFLTLDATYHELSGYWGGPDEMACLKAALLGSTPRPFSPLRLAALLASVALAIAALAALVRAKDQRAFVWAALAALLTNIAFIAVTGK
ncbi:MAG TPA: glycosyltransferase family 39 protein, partial [Myxococcota bacterium]